MNSGEVQMENLYLKKLRLHHPWFRLMSFNSFKMLVGLGEIVLAKNKEQLYEQDQAI